MIFTTKEKGLINLMQFHALGLVDAKKVETRQLTASVHLPTVEYNTTAEFSRAHFSGLRRTLIQKGFFHKVEEVESQESIEDNLNVFNLFSLGANMPIFQKIVVNPAGIFPSGANTDEELEAAGFDNLEDKNKEAHPYNIARKAPTLLVDVLADVNGLDGEDFNMVVKNIPFAYVVDAMTESGIIGNMPSTNIVLNVAAEDAWRALLGDTFNHYAKGQFALQIQKYLKK